MSTPAAPAADLDLTPSACMDFPPSVELVCAPDVICGQWLCGEDVSVPINVIPPVYDLVLSASECEGGVE